VSTRICLFKLLDMAICMTPGIAGKVVRTRSHLGQVTPVRVPNRAFDTSDSATSVTLDSFRWSRTDSDPVSPSSLPASGSSVSYTAVQSVESASRHVRALLVPHRRRTCKSSSFPSMAGDVQGQPHLHYHLRTGPIDVFAASISRVHNDGEDVRRPHNPSSPAFQHFTPSYRPPLNERCCRKNI